MKSKAVVAIVEDDLFTRKILLRYLSNHGIQGHGFESGEELLSALEGMELTHVVSDVNLPGISGFEIGDTLRENFPDISRIVMTSPNDQTEIQTFLEKGFDDVLLKPVSEEDLMEVIGLQHEPFTFPTLETMIEDANERKEILENLVTESRRDAEQIRQTIVDNDTSMLLLLVHRFVGRLGQFDQHELSDQFRKLEASLIAGIPVHTISTELTVALNGLIDFTDQLERELHSIP